MGTTAILLGICFDNSDGLPLERVQIAYCSACIATPFCPASGCKFCVCRPYQLLGSDKCVVMNDLGYICMLDLTARISQRGLEQCQNQSSRRACDVSTWLPAATCAHGKTATGGFGSVTGMEPPPGYLEPVTKPSLPKRVVAVTCFGFAGFPRHLDYF